MQSKIESMNRILEGICKEFGVDPKDLTGDAMTRPIADARHAFALVASEAKYYVVGHSNRHIADALNCCPSSVVKGLRFGGNKFDTDPSFRDKVNAVKLSYDHSNA
jgi:chromosomal replication initiation ATPase DnaA